MRESRLGLEGYSMRKLLTFGLILPAIVVSSLFTSFFTSLKLGLPLNAVAAVVTVGTFIGFAVGLIVIIKLSRRIVEYARIDDRR